MDSIYRRAQGRAPVRTPRHDLPAAWPVAHERTTPAADGARTHPVSAGHRYLIIEEHADRLATLARTDA